MRKVGGIPGLQTHIDMETGCTVRHHKGHKIRAMLNRASDVDPDHGYVESHQEHFNSAGRSRIKHEPDTTGCARHHCRGVLCCDRLYVRPMTPQELRDR